MEMKNLKLKISDTASAADLGDWLGLTVNEIAAHAVRAKPGGYALKKTVQSFCAHVRRSASGRESPAVTERRRLISATADLAETKAQIEAGTLMSAAAVEARWSSRFRMTMSMMMAIPTRVAARIPSLSRGDTTVIDDIVREKLTVAGTYNECDD